MIKISQQEFVNRSIATHNNKYDYSKSIYLNTYTPIIIICPTHGEFLQLPSNHLVGRGCKQCKIKNRTYSIEKFIKLSTEKHGNLYDYSKANYINNYTKIEIICLKHGSFWQIPVDHYKHGCNQCAIENRAKSTSFTQEEFISIATNVHKNKYDYSLVNYKNSKTEVKIMCKKHGIFLQKPIYHLSGCGCPICSRAGLSKAEKHWLDSLGILPEFRQFNIKINNTKIRVDGYDPETNTVYEYNGDYWHGNPLVYNPEDINSVNHEKFGILYQKTLNRENLIKSANYNLIVKWETEHNY